MTFTDQSDTAAYQNWATNESKAYIAFFFLTCLAFAVFGSGALGWVWLIFIPAGMFAASIVGGAFSIAYKYLEYRGILIIPSLVRFAGLIVVVSLTWRVLTMLGR